MKQIKEHGMIFLQKLKHGEVFMDKPDSKKIAQDQKDKVGQRAS